MTARVRREKMLGASTPLRYALTSGIPDPPAAGDTNAVIDDASSSSARLPPANTQNAVQ